MKAKLIIGISIVAVLLISGIQAEFVAPGPSEGPCTTPVNYYAIVINGGNKPRQPRGVESANQIVEMLKAQNYAGVEYLTPSWDSTSDGRTGAATYDDIRAAISRIKGKIKCVDRLFVYIVGHGVEKGKNILGQTWTEGGLLLQGYPRGADGKKPVAMLTPSQLSSMLGEIPACPGEDCKTQGKTCHMSIVIESCNSENFFDVLKGPGRTVVATAKNGQGASMGVKILGREGNAVRVQLYGSDFTNGYVKDMNSPGTADTDGDKTVSVAEAYASGKAKLSVAKKLKDKEQNPMIDNQECECLPLTCTGCKHDGVVSSSEECDSRATPNGCPSDKPMCSQDCYCYSIGTVTPPLCPPPTYDDYGTCNDGCTEACVINDQGCYICPQEDCNNDGESDAPVCAADCPYPCGVSDQGCYTCPTGPIICNYPGEYAFQSSCEQICIVECVLTQRNCYLCPPLSCFEDGTYNVKAYCDDVCPRECVQNSKRCWYCPAEDACVPPAYKYMGECNEACDNDCVMGDDGCYSCPTSTAQCPTDRYTPDECAERKKPNQRCVDDSANPGCQYLQTLCQNDEFISSDCDDTCTGDDECIVSDADVPCYACGTAECAAGEYPTSSECDSACTAGCIINEATNCYRCPDVTCESQGMYSSQSACEGVCHSPSYCEYSESKDCWRCRQVTVTCGTGLYDSSDCDDDCDHDETCEIYGDGPCYYCKPIACPDLIVTAFHASVHRSASTHCSGEYCTTDCSMYATFDYKIRNVGTATAGSSQAKVTMSPGGDEWTDTIESLAPGAVSATYDGAFTHSGTVSGSGIESCAQLEWWSSTYTFTATADYNNQISECNEDNNVATLTPQPT